MKTLLFILLALLCEIVGTVGGFGSSVFFVPLSQFFFSIKVVLGLTALLHVASNLAKIVLFGKHTNLRLMLLFGIPGIAGVVGGAFLIAGFEAKYANLFLALLLVIFSTIFLSASNITNTTN